MRESPSVEIMELLQERGASIAYSDPHVPVFPAMRAHHFELNSLQLDEQTISAFDCVVLATAHQAFDYNLIARCAQLIVDTRGAFRQFNQENIVKA